MSIEEEGKTERMAAMIPEAAHHALQLHAE